MIRTAHPTKDAHPERASRAEGIFSEANSPTICTSRHPLPQPLYNEHFRDPLRSAENTGLITPLESPLPINTPVIRLESALPKNAGGVVFRFFRHARKARIANQWARSPRRAFPNDSTCRRSHALATLLCAPPRTLRLCVIFFLSRCLSPWHRSPAAGHGTRHLGLPQRNAAPSKSTINRIAVCAVLPHCPLPTAHSLRVR